MLALMVEEHRDVLKTVLAALLFAISGPIYIIVGVVLLQGITQVFLVIIGICCLSCSFYVVKRIIKPERLVLDENGIRLYRGSKLKQQIEFDSIRYICTLRPDEELMKMLRDVYNLRPDSTRARELMIIQFLAPDGKHTRLVFSSTRWKKRDLKRILDALVYYQSKYGFILEDKAYWLIE